MKALYWMAAVGPLLLFLLVLGGWELIAIMAAGVAVFLLMMWGILMLCFEA